jgi:hypothetical protein
MMKKIGGSFDVELIAGKEGEIVLKGKLPLIIVEVEEIY